MHEYLLRTNSVLNRRELEQQFHYSADYLNKIVKQRSGMTLVEYSQAYRMKQAARLICTTTESIEKISQEFGDSVMVGAGTVLTCEQAQESIRAGAAFLLSPTMLDKKILDLCREKHVISVPGAFYPTEIKKSFEEGADIIKVFPEARLGIKYLSVIAAPLG